MKRYITPAIRNCMMFLSLAVCFTACDDFLDIQPKGRVIVTTADDYRKMLTQAYSIIPEDRGLATFRSDEFNMDATLSKEDISSFKDIWCWNDSAADNSTSSFGWRNYYQIIFEANQTIQNRDKITEGTPAVISQLTGEAYMLRAYMHFLLVNLFGEPYTAVADPYKAKGIPLKLDNDPDKMLSRNSVGEVYDRILTDIDSAQHNLNVDEWDAPVRYRFSRLAAEALLSRVYLYMGKWPESLAAAENVLARKSALSDLSAELPNAYNSVENILALEQVMTSVYVDAGKVNRDLFRAYGSGDLRRAKYYRQQTASNILCIKGGSNTYSCSLRTGEMYLNAAEAAARTGDVEKARNYLYALMKTRYTADSFATQKTAIDALDQPALIARILDERRLELAFEGHRWFDLRRTTRPAITKTYGTTTYTLSAGDSRYTLRIPADAVAANPSLGQ